MIVLLSTVTSLGAGRSQCAHAPPYPHCTADYPLQHRYAVKVLERDPFHGRPLIAASNGDSTFEYNFNGPWIPTPPGSDPAKDSLIVRIQENWRLPNATHPEWTDTGALVAVKADLARGTVEHIHEGLVFWPGTSPPPQHQPLCTKPHPLCGWGAIDPRVTYRPKTLEYYLTWDNCTFECAFRSSMLSVSKDPFNHESWTLVGPVIPKMQTAGVSLLFRDETGPDAKHLAFVSSYNCFTILLAESSDGKSNWTITDPTWMQGRPGCWDACGTIAGAQPERLSTGDYFLLYNIDTEAAGLGNDTKPLGRCTIGWAILNGTDPRQVVARSSSAIVTPTMPWDTTQCNGNNTIDSCQTPNVIFATGLKPLGNDAFLVIYGGGDTDTAAIKIQVEVAAAPSSPSRVVQA